MTKLDKKTATITWLKHYNYGTYLQAYALQQYIKSLGYENVILDDHYLKNENKSFFSSALTKFKMMGRDLISYRYGRSRKKTKKLFNVFSDNHLSVEHNLNSDYLNSKYNRFICGSDQIWNPGQKHLVPYYYANFTKHKKIAYAPSIGVSVYPDFLRQDFIDLTSDLTALSIREEVGRKIVSSLLNREIETVVDPTLLLTDQDWKQIISTDNQTKPFVLAYFLSPNSWYIDYVMQYAKEKELPLKMFFVNCKYTKLPVDLITVGPVEFLQLIHDASYFFTDSFHGTIFATVFETLFITFKRFSDHNAKSQNSRVENLFSKMNISERFIGKNECRKIKDLPPINFEKMKESLSVEIEHSKKYLIEALSK